MSKLLQHLSKLSDFLYNNLFGLRNHYYEPIFVLNNALNSNSNGNASQISINDLMSDGLLWGVPKRKLSIERRIARRFPDPRFPHTARLLYPKTNIAVCDNCGHEYETHTLCNHCYERVKEETDRIKEAMRNAFKNKPIEEDVVVFYKNDKKYEKLKGNQPKRIIEMETERPQWFAKNLLSKVNITNKWNETSVAESEQLQPKIKD